MLRTDQYLYQVSASYPSKLFGLLRSVSNVKSIPILKAGSGFVIASYNRDTLIPFTTLLKVEDQKRGKLKKFGIF